MGHVVQDCVVAACGEEAGVDSDSVGGAGEQDARPIARLTVTIAVICFMTVFICILPSVSPLFQAFRRF
jgi:hypothetical protein